jgi:hypothetical protein
MHKISAAAMDKQLLPGKQGLVLAEDPTVEKAGSKA